MPQLREDIASDGTVCLRSPLLESAGFPHAFSTRIGPSGNPFDLSRPGFSPIETPVQTSRSNLDRFAELVDPQRPDRRIASPRQVHGNTVVDAAVADESEADAVITGNPDMIAAIRTADCVGILVACPASGMVAAIHAGWRGLVADAPGAAVELLCEQAGTDPTQLLAAIGPAIGEAVYEVGTEVVAEFENSGLGSCVRSGSGRPHLDLHAAAGIRLERKRIPSDQLEGKPICTYQDPRFFSFRGDGPRSGRLLAGISPRMTDFS